MVGKLPFAGYSVIKEPPPLPRGSFGAPSPILEHGAITRLGNLERACLAVARGASREAKAGGEYRARTGDLLDANQALSQLS